VIPLFRQLAAMQDAPAQPPSGRTVPGCRACRDGEREDGSLCPCCAPWDMVCDGIALKDEVEPEDEA
jgi:hypothetical protein